MVLFISIVTLNQTLVRMVVCVCVCVIKTVRDTQRLRHLCLYIFRSSFSFPLTQVQTHAHTFLIASNSKHVHASLVSCCRGGVVQRVGSCLMMVTNGGGTLRRTGSWTQRDLRLARTLQYVSAFCVCVREAERRQINNAHALAFICLNMKIGACVSRYWCVYWKQAMWDRSMFVCKKNSNVWPYALLAFQHPNPLISPLMMCHCTTMCLFWLNLPKYTWNDNDSHMAMHYPLCCLLSVTHKGSEKSEISRWNELSLAAWFLFTYLC